MTASQQPTLVKPTTKSVQETKQGDVSMARGPVANQLVFLVRHFGMPSIININKL